MRRGVRPSLAGICPTAHEGILGGSRGSPAVGQEVTGTFRGRAGPRREPLGQPVGTRGFLLRAGRWVWGPPQGMAGPQPTPGCSMGRSHTVHVSAPSYPHRRGDGNVGDVGLVQAMSGASRRGCSGSDPRAPHLTSVLRPQPLRPRPLSSALPESPHPFPSGSERGSIAPGIPPPQPGGYFGFGEKGKAAPGGRLLWQRAGDTPQHAGDGSGRGKRNANTAPCPPLPPRGSGKEDLSHLKRKMGFFGRHARGAWASPGVMLGE